MKKKPKARMGRPPKDPEEKQSAFLGVKLTRHERALIQAEADRLGIAASALLMLPWRKGKTK